MADSTETPLPPWQPPPDPPRWVTLSADALCGLASLGDPEFARQAEADRQTMIANTTPAKPARHRGKR